MTDPVAHPSHYTDRVPGIECIEVSQHFNFNLGNAIKYIWRSGTKTPDPREDLRKAIQYLEFEIDRIEEVQWEHGTIRADQIITGKLAYGEVSTAHLTCDAVTSGRLVDDKEADDGVQGHQWNPYCDGSCCT